MAGEDWLREGVIYQIFPHSFADGERRRHRRPARGLGAPGLPAWLGVDTIWFNPCFASPFRDAGYDVADYCRIAPRYGTNEDLVASSPRRPERGIRVLLDLVAGHTSVEHPWFRAIGRDDPSDDRYIWSDRPGAGRSSHPRGRAPATT